MPLPSGSRRSSRATCVNTPRFATLPSIMRSPSSSVFILENSLKAKKKPIAQKGADAYGVDLKSRLQVLKLGEPPHRKAGIRVKSVTELLDKLHDEASRRRRRRSHSCPRSNRPLGPLLCYCNGWLNWVNPVAEG